MRKSGSRPSARAAAGSSADAAAVSETAEFQVIVRWFEAFNARDLDAMLLCMSPAVTFQPLRLRGIERTYAGYDGVARWHERFVRLQPDYRMEIEELSIPVAVTVLAIGHLRLEGMLAGAPFWGVHTVEHDVIVTARHCLGDADLAHPFGVPWAGGR